MGRPPNADAEATRQRILEAACEILLEGGPGELKVRAVARRANVSPGLIHHHFIDRDGLVDVVVDTMYDGVHEIGFDLLELLAAGSSVEELVEQTVRRMFRHAVAHKPYVRLMLTTVIRTGELDPARTERTQIPLLATAATQLAQRLGLTETQIRMRIRSLVLLVSRYAVFEESEVARLVGDSSDPLSEVESHLVEVAKLILLKA